MATISLLAINLLDSANPISREGATSGGPAPKELLHDYILPEEAALHLILIISQYNTAKDTEFVGYVALRILLCLD